MNEAPLEGCSFTAPILITALSVFAMLVLGCATTPTGPIENTVDCKTYVATEHDDRIGQWVNTFLRSLESNSGLERYYRTCVMNIARLESADIGLLRVCRDNPNLNFRPAVEEQLEKQFQMCGLTFEPPTG